MISQIKIAGTFKLHGDLSIMADAYFVGDPCYYMGYIWFFIL